MTKSDVIAVLGLPSQRYDAIGAWHYGYSTLQFQGERLIAVSTSGEIPVERPRGPSFTLREGMSPKEVVAGLGVPSQRYDSIGVWHYGYSTLQFEGDQLVAVSDSGQLRVERPTTSRMLREGMTKRDVVAALGMPSQRYDSIGLWHYGYSTLQFEGDRLIAVSSDGDIRVERPLASSVLLQAGMSKAEVVAALGMPTQRYDAIGSWHYGYSTLQFRGDQLVAATSDAGPEFVVSTGPSLRCEPRGTWRPGMAENGDLYNADNDGDGRVEPIHVGGYFRKDGTYVRGHYRARARK